MDLSIFFVGTGGSAPTARRGLPALLVRRRGDQLLFDCGEGTQRQLVSSMGLADVNEIYLTHFHADHWLGLPGMLKTFDLRGREQPLTIHGPVGLEPLMALVMRMGGRPGYEIVVVELEAGATVVRDGYRIAPVAVDHRGPAFGYVLFEDQRPGVFDADVARALGLVEGPEFGRVQRGETVRGVTPEQVLGPPRPGRKLVLSGDTTPSDALRVAAHQADVLVHEATFAEDERERAAETGHSTASGAATVARDAEVRLLALNHVSMRHPIGLLRDEARAIFPATVIPRDFDTIEVPLPERGEPMLVRWSDSLKTAPPDVRHAEAEAAP
jgi:ribonuclease Z